MNNEKLKIAIYGYAPHGLKIDTSYYEDTKPQTLSYLDDEESVYVRVKRKSGQYVHDLLQSYDLEYIKPILFPTSSLCKEIQLADYNNGVPFVPIVEIARLCAKDKFGLKKDTDFVFTENEVKYTHDDIRYCFSFNEKSFLYSYNWKGETIKFVNQLLAFELLNRWKIDYRGLIAEGLAIEVNEENNHYL